MPVEIFQPIDLVRRGRAVLDEARRHGARIRDRDGFSLIVLPEERVRLLQTFAEFSENLLALERRIETPTEIDRKEFQLGGTAWTWLRVIDSEDLHAFIVEMRQALLIAIREEKPDLPDEVLERWRITAQAIDNPERREVLMQHLSAEDFVEIERPGPALESE